MLIAALIAKTLWSIGPFVVTFGRSCTTISKDCAICFPVSAVDMQCSGVTSITIRTGLGTGYHVYVVVIDKFGNTFWQHSITDSSNNVSLLASSFPPEYFNSYAGDFEIFLTTKITGGGAFVEVPFFPDVANPSTSYNCVTLTITA